MKYLTQCCHRIVESKHRHDYQTCPCGKTSVDGGDDYTRGNFDPKIGFPIAIKDGDLTWLKEYDIIPKKKKVKKRNNGK